MPDLAVRYTPTDLDTESLGDVFVKSGFFKDTRDKAQAIVKILAGRELGFGPIASMQGVYLVNGRVTLSANLVGAAIKRSKRYDYRVVKLDHTECRLTFFEQGTAIGDSRFTNDDAKTAGLSGSDTYTKYIRNMLFSRALTNGARWYCPDVFNGPIYTPDEVGAQVDMETGEVLDATPAESFVPLRAQDPVEDQGPNSLRGRMLERYGRLLSDARNAGLIKNMQDWILPSKATEAYITGKGKELNELFAKANTSGDNQSPRLAPGESSPPPAPRPRVTVRSVLGQQLANLVEAAAAGDLPFDDCKVEFPADEEQVIRAIERLQDRIQAKEDELAAEALV